MYDVLSETFNIKLIFVIGYTKQLETIFQILVQGSLDRMQTWNSVILGPDGCHDRQRFEGPRMSEKWNMNHII